jgi:ERF superfamily
VTAAARPASPIAEALARLQASLPHVGKTADGQYGKYADLTVVSAALLPLLANLGLAFTACPTMLDGAFVLDYQLKHVSGDAVTGLYPLPDPNRLGPQALGAAITYARRYALCAVTGLAPGGDDDDAQAAEAGHRAAQRKPPARRAGAEHEQLRAQTLSGSKRAERTRPTAPERSQWDSDGPVDPATGERDTGHVTRQRATQIRQESEAAGYEDNPEDRPGSIGPGQHRALERLLGMWLGQAERDTVHGVLAGLLHLDDLSSLNDLSMAQAAAAIRAVQAKLDEEKEARAHA